MAEYEQNDVFLQLSNSITSERQLLSYLSPLTSLPLTPHLSPLTSHLLPLTSYLSPLTTYHSPTPLKTVFFDHIYKIGRIP